MPWFTSNTPRKRLEVPGTATLDDLMGAMRVVLNHAGGFASTLATLALSLSRLDARVEGIANELAAMRRHQLGDDGQADEDQEVPADVQG